MVVYSRPLKEVVNGLCPHRNALDGSYWSLKNLPFVCRKASSRIVVGLYLFFRSVENLCFSARPQSLAIKTLQSAMHGAALRQERFPVFQIPSESFILTLFCFVA